MKPWFTLLFFLWCTHLKAQNEFSGGAFTTTLRKIFTDARNGFVLNKGARQPAAYEELAEEYKATIPLSPADSGKIVFPKNSNPPYALYYFEPARSRLKIDQRALGLREAIGAAYAKLLYTETDTKVVGDHVYTDTYFFDHEGETDKKKALFRIAEYPCNNNYCLALAISGPLLPATAPAQ